jgi:hypothetical protein
MPIGAAMMGFGNVNVGTYANRGVESDTFNWEFINTVISLNGVSTILTYPTPAGTANSGNYTGNVRTVERVLQTDYGTILPSGETYCLKMSSVASYTTTGSNGVSYGPATHTADTVSLVEGDIVEFNWKCYSLNNKGYKLYSYLLDKNTGDTINLCNLSGNSVTEWDLVTKTIAAGEEGEYYTVFVSGFYDTNAGTAAAASFNTVILLDNLIVK